VTRLLVEMLDGSELEIHVDPSGGLGIRWLPERRFDELSTGEHAERQFSLLTEIKALTVLLDGAAPIPPQLGPPSRSVEEQEAARLAVKAQQREAERELAEAELAAYIAEHKPAKPAKAAKA
jgi:hypothetical protein